MASGSIKSSVKDTLIYGMGNIAIKLVGFILIPFYTNTDYFSVAEFGALGILEITAQVLAVVLGLSLPQSLFRWYWDKDYSDKQKSVFFTSLAAQTAVSLLFCLIFSLLAKQISVLIFSDERFYEEIILLTVSTGLQSLNTLVSSLLRLQSRATAYTVTNTLKLVVVLGITLFLVVGEKMGIAGIYTAQIIGNGLFLLVLFPYIFRNIQVHLDLKALRGMISYGAPLLWAALFTVILNVIDRYSLNFLSALESVAVYTLAFKIASTLKLVVADSIKLAVGPLIIKKMDLPGHERFYTKIWLYSSFVLMFGIVGLSLFSQEVVSLVSSSAFYDKAFFLIPVLTLSVFFVNLKDLNVYGLVISKKTGAMGLIVAIASAAGVGLNALLIPVLNTFGAALASFTAQLLFWLMVYKISQKHYPLKYETRKLLLIIIIGTAFAFSGFLLKDLNLLPRIGIKLLLLAAYPLAYLPLHFYEKAEIEAFKGFVRKWSRLSNLKSNIRSVSGDLDT